MSDGFVPAAVGPQPAPAPTAQPGPDPVEAMRKAAQENAQKHIDAGSDPFTAIEHLIVAHTAMMEIINHAAAVLPALGGMGMMSAQVNDALARAAAAINPPAPESAPGPQPDHT